MNILGPLPKTQARIQFIIVMTDRYSKWTRDIPSTSTTALHAASIFLDYLLISYELPVELLTNNWPQYVAKFLETLCKFPGLKHPTATATNRKQTGKTKDITRRWTRVCAMTSPSPYVTERSMFSRVHTHTAHKLIDREVQSLAVLSLLDSKLLSLKLVPYRIISWTPLRVTIDGDRIPNTISAEHASLVPGQNLGRSTSSGGPPSSRVDTLYRHAEQSIY